MYIYNTHRSLYDMKLKYVYHIVALIHGGGTGKALGAFRGTRGFRDGCDGMKPPGPDAGLRGEGSKTGTIMK